MEGRVLSRPKLRCRALHRESLSDIRRLERLDHFAEIALHYTVEIIKREADPMIRDAVLWKIVSPNFFFAAPGADLTFARGRIFRFFFALLFLEQTRAQDRQRLFLILLLTSAILAPNNRSGRNMHDLHRGISRVHALTARPASATNFDPQILRLQLKLDVFRLRQHRHRRSGSMNAALRFRRGYALHTMDSTFVAEFPKNRFTGNAEDHILQSA